MDIAAANGDVAMLLRLHRNGGVCTSAVMDAAASNGHLNVVRYLYCVPWYDKGCTAVAMTNAAARGYLAIVQFLFVNLKQQATNAAISAAAENGYLQVVKYLHSHLAEPCTAEPITRARLNIHRSVVEFLLQHRDCRRALEEEYERMVRNGLPEQIALLRQAEESSLRTKIQALIRQEEDRIRAEEEAKLREEEKTRIRAEMETKIRALENQIRVDEEAKFREMIRAEIRADVVAKLRDEVLAEVLADAYQTCPICHMIPTESTTTECDHEFCRTCLSSWLRQSDSCPMCRSDIS